MILTKLVFNPKTPTVPKGFSFILFLFFILPVSPSFTLWNQIELSTRISWKSFVRFIWLTFTLYQSQRFPKHWRHLFTSFLFFRGMEVFLMSIRLSYTRNSSLFIIKVHNYDKNVIKSWKFHLLAYWHLKSLGRAFVKLKYFFLTLLCLSLCTDLTVFSTRFPTKDVSWLPLLELYSVSDNHTKQYIGQFTHFV